MSKTGFKAYACYLYTKNIHFSDNKHNIMNLTKVPLKDKLMNSWNNKRRKTDGIKFREIEEECSNIKQLALLYSSYYVENPNFYIQEIFEDDFEKYKNNVIILKNLKECLTNDLRSVIMHIQNEEITAKSMFTSSTSIPQIFKMGYSINTLVIMEELFKLSNLNKDIKINSLEEEAWKNVLLNLKWYRPIIQTYLDKENWKEIAKEIFKK